MKRLMLAYLWLFCALKISHDFILLGYASSCAELQRGAGGGGKVQTDGEYSLLIPSLNTASQQNSVSASDEAQQNIVPEVVPSSPQLLTVFCAGMKRKQPREYLSLPSGENENYARVHKHRLGGNFEIYIILLLNISSYHKKQLPQIEHLSILNIFYMLNQIQEHETHK